MLPKFVLVLVLVLVLEGIIEHEDDDEREFGNWWIYLLCLRRGSLHSARVNYDEFLEEVQRRGGFASREEAAAAVQCTFQTLAERLSGEESTDLAAQLPDEVADCLFRPEEEKAEKFPLDEFFNRVGSRAGVGMDQGEHYTRTVMKVLGIAVTPEEIEEAFSHLPADFRALLRSETEEASEKD